MARPPTSSSHSERPASYDLHAGHLYAGRVRAAVAIVLAAGAVLALGLTSRDRLTAQAPTGVRLAGTYEPSGSQDWLDELTDPSAWRSGRFRGSVRHLSRREREAIRQREEMEEREERLRAERSAREEARNYARARGTYRTVCVRLCDGFFFPISFSTTPDRFAADESACNSQCRSPSRLYVYPNPGGEPEQMVDTQGEPYSALKTAFLFRTTYDASCTCKPHPWEPEAMERHRRYADRANGRKPAVAAKVEPEPRIAAPDPVSDPPPTKSRRRPDGAMLLGASPRDAAPTATTKRRRAGRSEASAPRRSGGRLGYGDRHDWRHRAFSGY